MIVEHIATRHGGHELLPSDEFHQVIRCLSDRRVSSLKEKSESYEVLSELMRSDGWKKQVRLGTAVGRRVDFYKSRARQAVEVIASTPVWIASTLARLANIKNAIKALYLVLSTDQMNCSFQNALEEIDNVANVLITNHALVVIGCRSFAESQCESAP